MSVPSALQAAKGRQGVEATSGAIPRAFREQAVLDASECRKAKRVLGMDWLTEVERTTKREMARSMAKRGGRNRTCSQGRVALDGWANTGRHVCASQVRQPGLRQSCSYVFGESKRQPRRHVVKGKGEPRKVARREAWKCKTHGAAGEGNSGAFDFRRGSRKEVRSCINNHLRHSQSQNLESHLKGN